MEAGLFLVTTAALIDCAFPLTPRARFGLARVDRRPGYGVWLSISDKALTWTCYKSRQR